MILTSEIIKQKKSKNKKIKKIIKIIILPFYAIIIGLIIYTGYLKFIKKQDNVNIFGYKPYIVITGSMEPNYNIGDLIIVKDTNKENLKINDVITYTLEEGKDTITHRIVKILEENGQTTYITKGDNNSSEDSDIVNYNQVQGVVILKLSKMGTVITSLLTSTGIIATIIFILSFYIYDTRKEEKRIAREDARRTHNKPKYEKEDVI